MVNKCFILGNVGKNAEVRFTPSGQAVCNFTVATSENWKGKDGNNQQKTQWHNIVVWGKLAELCGQYVHKGRKVFVEGKIETRSWDDKQGNKKYTTEIIAQSVQFLSGPQDSPAKAGHPGNQGEPGSPPLDSFQNEQPPDAFGL